MEVKIIVPHGFCRGVAAAVHLAEQALADAPVYCLHDLVHNEKVVEHFRARGLRFVEEIGEVPEGGTVIFSAHGVTPEMRRRAQRRRLRVIDATCPFVARTHREARRYAESGVPVVVIGHRGHAEVVGVEGEVEAAGGEVKVVISPEEVATLPFEASRRVGVVSQTTLAAEDVEAVKAELARRYPNLASSAAAAICTATTDRQNAVKDFVRAGGDGVLVLGSASSSNTRRLAEVARSAGARWVARASGAAAVAALDFEGVKLLGVTSGASTPECVLDEVVAQLRASPTIAV